MDAGTAREIDDQPESWALSRRVFTAALALVWLAAFLSLAPQIAGLYGSHGILPVREFLDAVGVRVGTLERLHLVPTLFWIDCGDATLAGACWVGVLAAVALLLDFAPGPSALVCWLVYLSFNVAGGDFLPFQWDTLLLEAGLVAVFLAPWRLRRGEVEEEPPRAARWLLWWLVGRLMFESGAAKLASGDPTWRSLTALAVHFETQPIPTPLAFFAHHAPLWAQRVSAVVMFAIELGGPFLILAGRAGRRAACALFLSLQLLIAATGNYGFFNVLAAALSLSLLDDTLLARVPGLARLTPRTTRETGYTRRTLTQIFAAFVIAVSGVQVLDLVLRWTGLPEPPRAVARILDVPEALARPFLSINRYGLFAVMTTERDEISVEGSDDGVEWREYDFRYKPGPLDRAPPFLGPHMPRLDWQMWFAALSNARSQVWFQRFVQGLLEGTPEVLGLLADDPFAGHPPRFVRATTWRYRFAQVGSDDWWRREELGRYLDPVSLTR